MKRLSFFVFFMACLSVSNTVLAQTEMFYYALPENYFEVKVKVQKETFYKGPLADYAREVTGLSTTVQENKVQYKILSITVKELSRADKSQLYKLKKTCNRHRFYFSNSGLLNMEKNAPNHSKGKGAIPPIEQEKQGVAYIPHCEKSEGINHFAIYSADAVMEKYDTAYTYEEIDSVLVQIPHITRSLVVKPTKQQAEDAMENLEKIREARWLLISGDREVDFSQLGLMLAELQKMENNYLSLFSGMLDTAEEEYTFIVYPTQKETVFSLPLFRFSTADGITGKEVGTKSYALHFEALDAINELIEEIRTDTEKQKLKMDNNGKTVYYRQPQVYAVSLLENGKTIQEFGVFQIAQLGEILSLPKKVKQFQLDPFTGGLKSVKF